MKCFSFRPLKTGLVSNLEKDLLHTLLQMEFPSPENGVSFKQKCIIDATHHQGEMVSVP